MLKISEILYYISTFSVLIPIFFLLKRKENFKITIILIFGVLFFLSGLSDLLSFFLDIKFKVKNSNAIISNIYTLFEFFLLNYIFFLLLKSKKLAYIAAVIFIIFFVINILWIQSFNKYQIWPIVLESIIFIVFSIKYHRHLLKTTYDLILLPSFWLTTGVYLYFALFLFCITSYIIKNTSQEVQDIAWGFHNLNNIVKNILFAVGIYCVSIKREEDDYNNYEANFNSL